jgi:cobalt/nickel transport system permease protein
MHIPDGFLDTRTWVALSAVSAGAVGIAVKRTQTIADEKHVPLLGVMAAFIFAAQMVNFPVAGGTSGHFMGGALAAIMLGPFSAVLVMTTLLMAQCFLFQDGGVTALGANIFNMAVVGPFAGYYIYRFMDRCAQRCSHNPLARSIGIGVAAWASIVLASLACSAELALSGTVNFAVAAPAVAGIHSIIGIGEGIITVLIVSSVIRVRADLFAIEKI